MAWIQYDVKKLNDMKKTVDSTVDTLTNTRKDLVANLTQLKTDWNTPAGKKFFKDINTDWEPEIEKYVTALKTLSRLLDSAGKSYQVLDNKIAQIPKP